MAQYYEWPTILLLAVKHTPPRLRPLELVHFPGNANERLIFVFLSRNPRESSLLKTFMRRPQLGDIIIKKK